MKLHVNSNSITKTAADDIAAVVLGNSKLQVLNLGDNNFQTAGVIKIAKALQSVSSLTDFYLDKTASAILHNRNLQKLDLDGNFIKAVGMRRMLWHYKTIPLSLYYTLMATILLQKWLMI